MKMKARINVTGRQDTQESSSDRVQVIDNPFVLERAVV